MALDHQSIQEMWTVALGRQLEGNGSIVQAEHLVRLVESYYNVGQDEGDTTEPPSDFVDTESEAFVEDFKDSTPPTTIAVAESEALQPRAAWPFPGSERPDNSNWPYKAGDETPVAAAPSPVETSAPAPAPADSSYSAPDSAP